MPYVQKAEETAAFSKAADGAMFCTEAALPHLPGTGAEHVMCFDLMPDLQPMVDAYRKLRRSGTTFSVLAQPHETLALQLLRDLGMPLPRGQKGLSPLIFSNQDPSSRPSSLVRLVNNLEPSCQSDPAA